MLFSQKLGPHAPLAAVAVAAAASDADFASLAAAACGRVPAAHAARVSVAVRRSYAVQVGSIIACCISCDVPKMLLF